ncbi:MAG: TPM domain-containing protein [Cyanobacteriota bacterium]|nr:TPM domain-containing protein [Cyanobacteriota bacterium]
MIQLLKRIFNSKYINNVILSIGVLVLAAGLFVAPAEATGIYQMPNLSVGSPTWVVDDAEVLSLVTKNKIKKTLESLAEETGNEVRLVTIRRLDYGETAASFTEKLFDKWFPTPEDGANQTLLVLDTLTNNDGITTGEGVKSIMSDEIADSVANETVQVPLRQGNKYNEALVAASDRLSAVLSGQPDPGPPSVEVGEDIQVARTFKTAEETDDKSATTIVIVMLVVATVVPMATYFWYQSFSG